MTDPAATLLSILPVLLGGVGLFLMGMILMSDGLKAAAGGSLQRILKRSTRSTWSAFLSGVGLTALVQSSSATTVATIGFVSAGLLSVTASIGVIIGANVGTTSTGWIVSLLGFKLNIGAIALPFIGVGALLRLLSTGRRANLGMALAGFGLIFIGIDFLQEAMGGLAQEIDLAPYAEPSLANRLILVLIGAVMTVLLQSSSAAVALTLTALNSGAIGMEQAAYLVIGQNLGTTVKAVLASMGASTPARRTALAHILFNVVTASLAFVLTPQLLALVSWITATIGNADQAVTIALFHTVFNSLGAFVFLPFTAPFARLVERLIPDRGPAFTRHLDRSLLQVPAVAVEAIARAFYEIAAAVLNQAVFLLERKALTRGGCELLWSAQTAIRESRVFLAQIHLDQQAHPIFYHRLTLLHASDHLDRLVEACLEFEEPVYGEQVEAAAARLAPELDEAAVWLQGPGHDGEDIVRHVAEASARQAEDRRRHRAWLLAETAAGLVSPDETQRRLESMRWVDRVGYHAWRALHHLAGSNTATSSEVYEEPEALLPDDSSNG
jgi:phosphate:Na+ symporter